MTFGRSLFAFTVAVLSLSIGPAHAAAQEKTLNQAKEEFAKQDRALNKSYEEAKAKLPEYLFAKVQEAQRDWIDYRDQRAKAAAILEGRAENENEKANSEYWVAMAYLTETRIEILQAWLKTNSYSKTWEGAWIDGYGGILLIAEKDDGSLSFTCTVVRGPSYHLGNIAGTAKANQSTARFSIKEEGEKQETWLTFLQQNDGRLRLIGENTQYYHGARAYFDGQYLRIRELTAEDRKEISDPEF